MTRSEAAKLKAMIDSMTEGATATVGQVVERAKHDPSDPVVKLTPRTWKGEDYRGRRFSQCDPNFLGMLAHVLDSFADRNAEDPDPQKQKYATWDRENAATARKWRAKLEAAEAVSAGRMTQGELDATF